MQEITNSFTEVLKSRVTNSLYGTFIICWSIVHWNFLYSLFFLDSGEILKQTGLLKDQYLYLRYFYFFFIHFLF